MKPNNTFKLAEDYALALSKIPSHVTSLSLRGNGLGRKGLTPLFHYLPDHITTLDLSANDLCDVPHPDLIRATIFSEHLVRIF
ncbi:TPA: hypothetical protein ACJ6J3_09560 [Legionella pneumophila]|uniref:hypothetical protein n=1 Tax=Legionella pneumophila TaxID=446 RepID=UPI0007774E24|nr:hypothetical protein [Legionella pneumophila]